MVACSADRDMEVYYSTVIPGLSMISGYREPVFCVSVDRRSALLETDLDRPGHRCFGAVVFCSSPTSRSKSARSSKPLYTDANRR